MPISNPGTSSSTWVLLASKTLANDASADFQSLAYYVRYLVVYSGNPSAGCDLRFTLNNDGGNNYANQYVQGATSTASAAQSGTVAYGILFKGHLNNVGGTAQLMIANDVANATKGFVSTYGHSATVAVNTGQYTAANGFITRITITPTSGNLNIGTISVYGLVS